MDRIYDLYDKPATAFREPYAAKVTKLFDGRQSSQLLGPAGTELAALRPPVDSGGWSPRTAA
jgi:hypothetical protein